MDHPEPTGASNTRVMTSKRIKIDIACDHCRLKKVKCDGMRPTCGTCSRKLSLRDKCRFSAGSSIVRNRTGDIPSTNHDRNTGSSRINNPRPDANAKRGYPYHNCSPRPPMQPEASHSSPAHHRSQSGISPESRQTDEGQGQRPLGASVTSTSPSVIDSMTAVVDEGTSTGEFFGISSAGSFTAQIKKAIDARLGMVTSGPPRQIVAPSRSAAAKAAGPDSMAVPDISYVLPPRRQADHLMELYWFYVDPLYPFLDRNRWTQSYNAIFNGTAIDFNERIFMATLNIVFALSTQLFESQTLEQRESSSEAYFKRAQELLPMSPWDAGSLELVQCLLVTSQYLQSTYNPHQTWMVVGSAIRMAQGLGLHLPETSADRPPEERELLRRIWYGCVLMDRMVSVTHGRPAIISARPTNDVPLPCKKPMSSESSQQTGGAYLAFFVESVRLYEIIHQIMIVFYGGSSGRSKPKDSQASDQDASDSENEDLDQVVRLDRSLSNWEKKLATHLRWNSLDTNTNEIWCRQTVILRMRFLHARILLLRPLLSRFCLIHSPAGKTYVDDTFEDRLVREGALFCVSTAQNMITTLLKHQTSDSTLGLLPAWWYRVYYIYSAATVLIGAKLRPDAFSAGDISRSWCQAISVLKAHEKFGQSARRCVTALHILSSKILQAVPGSGHGSEGNRRRILPRMTEGAQNEAVHEEGTNDGIPDLVQQLADEFEPIPDFEQQDFAEFNLDVNDMSWLNDMQGVWEILNE